MSMFGKHLFSRKFQIFAKMCYETENFRNHFRENVRNSYVLAKTKYHEIFAFRENKKFRINFNFDLPAQVPKLFVPVRRWQNDNTYANLCIYFSIHTYLTKFR